MPALRKIVALVMILYPLTSMADAMLAPVTMYDDALPLLHAMLIRNGALPYIDFFSPYFPLNDYLNAWVFSWWGMSVVSERLLKCFLYLLFLVTGYVYAKKTGLLQSASKTLLMLLLAAFGIALRLPCWNAFIFSIFAYLFYLFDQKHGSLKNGGYLLWAGVFSALTVFTRVNFGFYTITAITISMALYKKRAGITDYILYLLPVTVFTFCFLIYGLVVVKDLTAFLAAPLIYPLINLQTLNISVSKFLGPAVLFPIVWCILKYFRPIQKKSPHLIWLSFGLILILSGFLYISDGRPEILRALFLLSPLMALCLLVLHFFIVRLSAEEMSAFLMFAFFSHYFLKVPDYAHFFICVPLIIIFFLHTEIKIFSKTQKYISAVCFIFFLTVFVNAEGELPKRLADTAKILFSPASLLKKGDSKFAADPLPSEGPEAGIYNDIEELKGIQFLLEQTRSDEPIYIGAENHSHATFNNMRMQWLLGRPVATRYACFLLGLSDKEAIQKQIIEDLEKNRVEWAVLWKNSINPSVLRDARHSIGSQLLDDYLHSRFTPVKTFEGFTVYKKVR